MIPGHPGQPGGRLGTKDDVQQQVQILQDASAAVKAEAGYEAGVPDRASECLPLTLRACRAILLGAGSPPAIPAIEGDS